MTQGGRPLSSQKRESRKPPPDRLMPSLAFVGVIFVVVVVIIRERQTPGICSYDNVYRKVTCREKELRSFPADMNEVALQIHFGSKLDKQENFFTHIQAANFSRFTHLQELRLIKCGIEDIKSETFKPLANLKRLDLRYNRIQVINEETFRGLLELEFIQLSNNPIQRLPEYTFRDLIIDNLFLGNNPALIEISSKAFAGSTIRSLHLQRCSFASLRVDTFSHISHSLRELSITNHRQALVLPEKIFRGVDLDRLDLTNNGIVDTEFLEELRAREINLDDNPIVEFDCDECESLSSLRKLTLSNCQLNQLKVDDFEDMIGLQTLVLEENDIKIFNSSVFMLMDELVELDLSENDLVGFVGNFSNLLPSLRELELDDNDIQTLPRDLEGLFSRLENLTLHSNPLHCNCELLWLAKWMEKAKHRKILHQLDEVTCETPEQANFTHVSIYGFQCRAPTILNATFDSDGISLLCTADGDPAPTVTWLSPWGEEFTTVHFNPWDRDNFQSQSSYTISQNGNYTCVAKNVAGEERVTVNTREMPSSGLKFHVQSQEIEILETPQGFAITSFFICVLFYLLNIG